MASDPIVEASRRSRSLLIDALRRAGADTAHPSSIRCPFHEDMAPSAGIYCDEGVWRFKCHAACCDVNYDLFDVLARLEATTPAVVIAKAIAERKPDGPLRVRTFPSLDAIAATYPVVERVHRYANPDEPSRIDYAVIRWRESADSPKRFCACHQTPSGEWVAQAPPKPWPIYNRIRVRDAATIVLVEGEKSVEALAQLRVVATTTPAGAGKAEHCDLSPLAGKRIVLWPDNDPPHPKTGRRTGIDHMRDVQRRLEALDPKPSVLWLDPDTLNLPPKGDAADLVAELLERCPDDAATVVREIVDSAEPTGARSELRELIDQTVRGDRRCLHLPWHGTSHLSRALMPGTITLLCGDPGSAKSFLVLHALVHLVEHGIPTKALLIEENRAFHMNRLLAILDRNSQILSPEWVAANPDEARAAELRHAAMLDAAGDAIHSPPVTDQISQDDVIEWVRKAVESGTDVAFVDPVTIAARKGDAWTADGRFVAALVGAVAGTRTRLVLVTHPKSAANGAVLDSIAGGSAYQRFAQTVLWLQIPKPGKEFTVGHGEHGRPTVETPDRLIRVVKARNGPGQGAVHAIHFNRRTLEMTELGIVMKEAAP